MMPHDLLIEAMNAGIIGVNGGVLLYMVCRYSIYSWRDFGIVGLILVSVILRTVVDGMPPPSHLLGFTLLNVIFVAVLAMVWSRPSRLPPIDRRRLCRLRTIWVYLTGRSRREL